VVTVTVGTTLLEGGGVLLIVEGNWTAAGGVVATGRIGGGKGKGPRGKFLSGPGFGE